MIPRLPQSRRWHGCGAFQDQQNVTVLVVFGGLSGKTEFLNDILILPLEGSGQAWRQFEATALPYSNIILKSLVLNLSQKRCDIMFAGADGLYVCKKNFLWTKKPLSFSYQDKFTWTGITRLRGCWNDLQSGVVLNF